MIDVVIFCFVPFSLKKPDQNSKLGRLVPVSPFKCSSAGNDVVSGLPTSENSARTEVQKSVTRAAASGRIRLDPFRGKPGSVSFCGLTHQNIEGRKLVSSPFEDDSSSLLWVVAPLALISSLLVPQFFLGGAIEGFIRNEFLAGILELLIQ